MTSKPQSSGSERSRYTVEYKKIGKSAETTRLAGRVLADTFPTSTAFIKAKSGKVHFSDNNKGKRTGIVSGGYVQMTYGR